MNGKKAKALRKLVFNTKEEFRERKYLKQNSGQIVNVALIEQIEDGTEKKKYVAKRNFYQKLKRTTRRIPIAEVKKAIKNVIQK